jgi:hypothetical protein
MWTRDLKYSTWIIDEDITLKTTPRTVYTNSTECMHYFRGDKGVQERRWEGSHECLNSQAISCYQIMSDGSALQGIGEDS